MRATLDQFPGAVIVAVRGGEDGSRSRRLPQKAPEMAADDVAYIDDSEDEDL